MQKQQKPTKKVNNTSQMFTVALQQAIRVITGFIPNPNSYIPIPVQLCFEFDAATSEYRTNGIMKFVDELLNSSSSSSYYNSTYKKHLLNYAFKFQYQQYKRKITTMALDYSAKDIYSSIEKDFEFEFLPVIEREVNWITSRVTLEIDRKNNEKSTQTSQFYYNSQIEQLKPEIKLQAAIAKGVQTITIQHTEFQANQDFCDFTDMENNEIF